MSKTFTLEGLAQALLTCIGEDIFRPGLKDTPRRVAKSYEELYSGYKFTDDDVKKILTMFETDGYDEMVLLKNIEFYSTCEHHMLPFFGKAHIAYIPDKNIVGISKLARLLEIYSRRLQIQERIGRQIIDAFDKYVKPKGAACILEAQHFCMTSRGVNKQNSLMVTSALSGVFRTRPAAREELMRLIK
jgi:GTP cyclohydrolase I